MLPFVITWLSCELERLLQVWTGYTQSLRPGDNCITLNVDMACTAFLQEETVIQFICRAAMIMGENQLQSMNNEQIKKANKALSGLKVPPSLTVRAQTTLNLLNLVSVLRKHIRPWVRCSGPSS